VTTVPSLSPTHPHTLLAPALAEVVAVRPETGDTTSLTLRLVDGAPFAFQPGQFNMLSLPGVGEAAISLSSNPEEPQTFTHTIRAVGTVTRRLVSLRPGDRLGIRGPFGTPWPVEAFRGQNILLVAGGIGLAPLRPVIYHVLHHRQDYGEVILLYGARTSTDLLYTEEYLRWEEGGIRVMVTVDRADRDWKGAVGVVPLLFYQFRVDAAHTVVFTCGPEIMMRFVVYEAMARRIPSERLYLSLERNMKCGQALCGHCQLGPYFVCRDGPVFRFDRLEPYFNVEHW